VQTELVAGARDVEVSTWEGIETDPPTSLLVRDARIKGNRVQKHVCPQYSASVSKVL